ncbi:MAG: NifU N-terminal domain-containing protein [Anaerolineae bacterium]|nr:NifU N-terminal domain-containing protein [Anaerolineae bacterium]
MDKLNFGGVVALTIHPDHLIITRKPDVDWVVLIDEICDAIRDFYL